MAAPYQWQFTYGTAPGTSFTSDVLSWSGFIGRRNYQDNYAGNRFQITIKNQSNQAATFTRGTLVQIKSDVSGSVMTGRVNRVDYDDYPGNIGLSTATVQVDDALALAGRFYLENFTNYNLTESTTDQAQRTNTVYTGLNAPEVDASGGQSTAQGTATYTGTMLNRLNLLCQTERSQMLPSQNAGLPLIFFLNRKQVTDLDSPDFSPTLNTIGQVRYSELRRVQSGDNFMNLVSVTAPGITTQTATNSTSVTNYGQAGYNVNSLDSSASGALGNAQWLANSQSDPTTFRYEIDFDSGTADNAITSFLNSYLFNGNPGRQLTYRVPGAASDTTEIVIVEGVSISATPELTRFTAYASPATYYQLFTLNSSTFGILNTSRLGW